MKCASPYYHKGYNAFFPCGCCLACRAQKSMEWTLRLTLEQVYHKDTAFATLTYAPEFLPEHGSLSPTDLQAFLKRLRRRLDYKIRFYACGEYGDRFGRAHYHLIIFGLKPQDYEKVFLAWKRGRVEVEPAASQKAFRYVAGYVNKKIGRQKDWQARNPNLYPMFQRCSLGIGKRFVEERVPYFTPYLLIGGKRCRLGRYLRNKLAAKFGILESLKEKGIMMMQAEAECLVSEFEWRFPERSKFLRLSLGFSEYMLCAYKEFYGAAIRAFERETLIRFQRYKEGYYESSNYQRVRRVFA